MPILSNCFKTHFTSLEIFKLTFLSIVNLARGLDAELGKSQHLCKNKPNSTCTLMIYKTKNYLGKCKEISSCP